MKIQTTNISSFISVINILFLILLMFSVASIYVDLEIMDKIDYLIMTGSILSLLLLYYLGRPYFRYDSEGEVLIFENKKSVFFSMLKNKSADLPKYKLIDYKIKGKLRKNIEIFIQSRRSNKGYTKLVFNITYLPQNKRINLVKSLDRNIDRNNRSKGQKNTVNNL